MNKENSRKKLETPAEIMRAAVARAKAVPQGFDMDTWIENADTPCGTAGCFAYEICAVAGDVSQRSSIQEQAATLIGLDDSSPALFFLEQWPERFQSLYKEAGSPEGRADALGAVVESWIEGTWYEEQALTSIGGNVDLEGYSQRMLAAGFPMVTPYSNKKKK